MAEVDTTCRCSWWSITLNNPTEEDRQTIHGNPPRWLKYVAGQDERAPDTGTLHIQAYCITDQVRLSQVHKWLPRAHLKPAFTAEHRNTLREQYCNTNKKKNASYIEGTQFEHKYREENENLTMAGALTKLAELAYSCERYQKLITETDVKGKVMRTYKEVREREYWETANLMIAANPNLVALYTQPQYLRAWIHTRDVWVAQIEIDRQTSISVGNFLSTIGIADGAQVQSQGEEGV